MSIEVDIKKSKIRSHIVKGIDDEEAEKKLIKYLNDRKFNEDIHTKIYANQKDIYKRKSGSRWPVDVSLSQGDDKIARAERTYTDMLEEIIGTKFYAYFKTEITQPGGKGENWEVSIRRRTLKSIINDIEQKRKDYFDEKKQEKPDDSAIQKVIDGIEQLSSPSSLPAWFSLIGGIIGANMENDILNEPELIFYGVPLYNINRFEKATSDRKIKVRAIGDVFLAHQKGSEVNVTVDAKLTDETRYLILYILLLLQERGEKQLETIEDGELQSFIDNNTNISAGETESAAQDTIKNAGGLLEYEKHRTFPLITQFDIIFNMYLQTIEWHRNIEEGSEVINLHLIFRKWEPKSNIKIFDPHSSQRKIYQYPSNSSRVRKLIPLIYRTGRFIEETLEGGFRNDLFISEMRGTDFPEVGADFAQRIMDTEAKIPKTGGY